MREDDPLAKHPDLTASSAGQAAIVRETGRGGPATAPIHLRWPNTGIEPELLKVEGNDGPEDEKVARRYDR